MHDPAAGEKWFPITEASRHLTGVVLELSPSEEFCCTDQRVRLPFSVFWSGMRGNSHVIAQILVLSVVMEILILAAPFYMQLTVDEVIARGDIDLLLVLGLGFALLLLIKVASTAARSFIVLILQNYVELSDRRPGYFIIWCVCHSPFSKSGTSATSCRASARSSPSATCSRRD